MTFFQNNTSNKLIRLIYLISGLTAFLWLLLITIPAGTQILNNIQQVSDIKIKLQEASQWQEITQKLLKENQRLELYSSETNQKIGKIQTTLDYLQLIQNTAAKCKIQIQSIQPEEQQQIDSESIQLRALGTYHQIAKFLNELEHAPVLTWVDFVELDKEEKSTAIINAEIKVGIMKIENRNEQKSKK